MRKEVAAEVARELSAINVVGHRASDIVAVESSTVYSDEPDGASNIARDELGEPSKKRSSDDASQNVPEMQHVPEMRTHPKAPLGDLNLVNRGTKRPHLTAEQELAIREDVLTRKATMPEGNICFRCGVRGHTRQYCKVKITEAEKCAYCCTWELQVDPKYAQLEPVHVFGVCIRFSYGCENCGTRGHYDSECVGFRQVR
jgi:hypothetical protein